MNHLPNVLFCALITCSLSLKLLVEDNPIAEEWEADITFSYKPLLGKCTVNGAFKLTDESASSAYTGSDGTFCVQQCDDVTGYPAAVVTKYCRPGNLGENQTYQQVAVKWKTELMANGGKRKKECPHVYAKLASMGNTQATCTSTKITAFDIQASSCNVRAFEGDSTGQEATGTDVGYFCYLTAGIMWAKNDPKVKNIDGEEFDIMATGTFTLLSLQKLTSEKISLEVLSTIDRAGSRCGATYIQNITLRGQWVEDVGVPEIQVRAVSAVPKNQALEANFDGSWRPSNSQWTSGSVEKATPTRLNLKINKVKVLVTVDSHRIHEDGVRTKRFANFLNVNFNGVSTLSGISIRGLLGRDSHAEAAESPEDCTSGSLLGLDKSRSLSAVMLM